MTHVGPDAGPARERLVAAAAYRLWASRYESETAVSALEDRVLEELAVGMVDRRLLDVGCGVGRRLPPAGAGASLAVGIDLVPEMLFAGRRGGHRGLVAAGDVRRLPVASATFDVIWCRLVLGHLRDIAPAYAELERVGRPGADLVVTDFHPAAVAAGHRRTFVDEAGRVREVEHWIHAPEAHVEAARARGWSLDQRIDAPAGAAERPYYERAGRVAQLEAEAGLPLVLALRFRR